MPGHSSRASDNPIPTLCVRAASPLRAPPGRRRRGTGRGGDPVRHALGRSPRDRAGHDGGASARLAARCPREYGRSGVAVSRGSVRGVHAFLSATGYAVNASGHPGSLRGGPYVSPVCARPRESTRRDAPLPGCRARTYVRVGSTRPCTVTHASGTVHPCNMNDLDRQSDHRRSTSRAAERFPSRRQHRTPPRPALHTQERREGARLPLGTGRTRGRIVPGRAIPRREYPHPQE
ncbi:hypothetical protein JOF59_006413 [Streptomyces clavifer]|uniref:Uncharacterized protein n=1 Tax=Streptomyces clavifer TaxID=68188 RepID=A0ABS4VJ11_9ACTN|nr:hypothetical protein [Streptomyces clavifer]